MMNVIYEDDDVLVLDKLAGLAVHGDGRSEENTVASWIFENYPELSDVGEPMVINERKAAGVKELYFGDGFPEPKTVILRPGIVHRLDKETSGVLIIAKNQDSYYHLKNQFQDKTVSKRYLALVYGNFKDDEGTVDKPIGKSPKDYRLRDATSAARGELREAETHWKVLERFISPDHKNDYTLLEVSPKTGRTHQIRVHMKLISHPVVCDKLYAPGRECIEGLERHALHATSLKLTLPSDEEKTFEVPLPADFEQALSLLRN